MYVMSVEVVVALLPVRVASKMVRGRGFEPLNPCGTGACGHTRFKFECSVLRSHGRLTPSLTWLGSGENDYFAPTPASRPDMFTRRGLRQARVRQSATS